MRSRSLFFIALFAIGGISPPMVLAADTPQHEVIFADDLRTEHNPAWHLNNGDWKIVDGAWQGSELASDNHPATTRYKLEQEFTDAVIEFEFKLNGATKVGLSINDDGHHICKLLVRSGDFLIQKDDYDGSAGPDAMSVLAKQKTKLAPGEWHRARVTMTGPDLTAEIDGMSIHGEHQQIGMRKVSFAFVVGGQSASFRNVRLSTPKK